MPYDRKPNHPSCPGGKSIGVINSETGKLHGCHASDESAKAQVRALYAAEGSKKELAEVVEEAFLKEGDRTSNVLQALAGLDESVDAMEVPTERASLVDRFFAFVKGAEVGSVEKAAIKRENGIDFPARDFAYVPDPNAPATWKLRLTESPGKVTIAQLGRAAAAFSPGGFRGNRVDIPQAAMAAVKRRIRAEYRKLGVREDQIPPSVKETNRFAIWKQADGLYRWFAIYSNNFRDEDYPPEIISAESHELFVEMVDKGIVDYPELWHWHVPGTKWGMTDWVGYSDGFALASGTIDPGHEKEAESLAVRDDIGVSHGMPHSWIMRDKEDPTVITMHVTTEISPLPIVAAANKLTGFHVFKESDDMPLTDQKKEHLLNLGVPADQIALLEVGLKEAAAAATQAGLESKEMNDQTDDEAESENAEEPTEETRELKQEPQYATREEVAGAFTDLITGMKEQFVALSQQVAALTAEVKELKVDDEVKIAKAAQETPVLSLRDLISQSVIGNKEAMVDGRSKLAKQKPAEAKDQNARVTGIPFIDQMFATNGVDDSQLAN